MSQATNKSISFHLYPTGVKILGRTEFARRVESGQKAINVNVGAMEARDLETESLSNVIKEKICLLYTSPSPRDGLLSRMPSSA